MPLTGAITSSSTDETFCVVFSNDALGTPNQYVSTAASTKATMIPTTTLMNPFPKYVGKANRLGSVKALACAPPPPAIAPPIPPAIVAKMNGFLSFNVTP